MKQKVGSTKSDISNTFFISTRQTVGYFFMDGFVADLELNFQTSSIKFEGMDDKVTKHYVGIGLLQDNIWTMVYLVKYS